MKVSDLTNREVDLLVAQLEKLDVEVDAERRLICRDTAGQIKEWSPSKNWDQGGPILERNRIVVGPWKGTRWAATADSFPESATEVGAFGTSYLDAGMRCYVAIILGDEARS